MEHDPLKDPYGHNFTNEEIKELYLKFRKSYYDLEFREDNAQRTLSKILQEIRKVAGWRGASVKDADTLVEFVKSILVEMERFRIELLKYRDNLPFWKRLVVEFNVFIGEDAQHRLHLTAFGVGMLAFIAGFVVCWLAFVR